MLEPIRVAVGWRDTLNGLPVHCSDSDRQPSSHLHIGTIYSHQLIYNLCKLECLEKPTHAQWVHANSIAGIGHRAFLLKARPLTTTQATNRKRFTNTLRLCQKILNRLTVDFNWTVALNVLYWQSLHFNVAPCFEGKKCSGVILQKPKINE